MKIRTIESSILCFLRQLPRLRPCPPYKPYNACWPYNAHTPRPSKCFVFSHVLLFIFPFFLCFIFSIQLSDYICLSIFLQLACWWWSSCHQGTDGAFVVPPAVDPHSTLQSTTMQSVALWRHPVTIATLCSREIHSGVCQLESLALLEIPPVRLFQAKLHSTLLISREMQRCEGTKKEI